MLGLRRRILLLLEFGSAVIELQGQGPKLSMSAKGKTIQQGCDACEGSTSILPPKPLSQAHSIRVLPREQYPLIKEYSLNHNIWPLIV